jgi:ribose/xylose/arabinose/galactoside ABC-type transport system permease subunit
MNARSNPGRLRTEVTRQLLRHVPWLVAAAILLTMVLIVPSFSQPRYWLALGKQYFAPAVLALALTPIILTGGIDLSVGSTTVLSSVVIGALWRHLGMPLELALCGGLLVGLLAGLANGLLVTAGILPLVATLATRELFRGLAWTISGDDPVRDFPSWVLQRWSQPILGIPPPLLLVALLALCTWLVVHHTWVGRWLFALGDNEQAARFAGAPRRRLQLALYAWSGLVAGLCGVTLVARYGAARPDAEVSLELLAITGVVLGGVRITGGSGHVAGVLLGVVTVAILLAGLSSAGSTWRDTITGAVLIAVALLNEGSMRLAARLPIPKTLHEETAS